MAEGSSRQSAADKAAAYAADTFDKTKTTSKEATTAIEQTYVTASKSVVDFNLKLLEMAEQNVSVAIEFARRLPEAKTPAAFFELSAEHAHRNIGYPPDLSHGYPRSRAARSRLRMSCGQAHHYQDTDRVGVPGSYTRPTCAQAWGSFGRGIFLPTKK